MKSSASSKIASGSAKAACYVLWPALFLPSAIAFVIILKLHVTSRYMLGLGTISGPVYGLGVAALPALAGMAIALMVDRRQEPVQKLQRLAQTEMLVTSMTGFTGILFLLCVYSIRGWI